MQIPPIADTAQDRDTAATASTGRVPSSRVRGALVSTFRRVMRLYFRDIERVGQPPAAETRGRVVVTNHTNALIDPALVITDVACELSPIAKSTLWSVPGLRWMLERAGAVPIVRRKDTPDKDAAANADTFEKVAAHLAAGGNILIFPEGTSHNEPHVAPLRTGAARMLLQAEAKGGVAPTYQAAALEFDARDKFRSRCLLLWGPVRAFADHTGDAEERVRAATAQMHADLAELLVEGATHEERLRVARVAEILANDERDRSLERWNGIGRQVELANRTLSTVDPAIVARVAAAVDAYHAALDRAHLTDADVVSGHTEGSAERGSRLAHIALAPLAATGVALYAVPYFIPRLVARRWDADAVSTVKLATSLVVYPLWAAGLVAGAFVLLPPPVAVAAAAIVVASPFAALRWLDGWSARGGLRRTPTNEELAALSQLRVAAIDAIDEARRRLPS